MSLAPHYGNAPHPWAFTKVKHKEFFYHEPNLHRSWGMRVGGKLCLLVGVKTLPLLRRRCNIHLVKHSEKTCVYVEGTLYIDHFCPRNRERYYAYLSSMGMKLCLLVGVKTLPYWRIGIRTFPFICFMIYIGLVHDKFCLMLYDRLSLWMGDITKMQGQTWLFLILGPLFWKCPHPKALPYTFYK